MMVLNKYLVFFQIYTKTSEYQILNFRNQILALKLVTNPVENDSIKLSVS